jgi:ATP-dependent DNA helicase RecG
MGDTIKRVRNMAESQNVEWKESWRDEYLKWVCGFANAHGGTIWIGKSDKGEIIGVKDGRKLSEDIPNKIRNYLGIVADVNIHSEGGRDFLEIVVKPSSSPVSYKGEYHYRSGSTKQQLTGQALTQFIYERMGQTWDGFPVDGVSVDDLRNDSFDIFKEQSLRNKRISEDDLVLSNAELLDSLGVLTPGGRLTRAGVLLFHHQPEKWVRGAYIKIAFFETPSEIGFMDEIHGSLIEQANKVVDLFFLKYLKADVTYEGVTRVETYPYPRAAIREAIYNSICHKAYHAQIPIQIRVDSDNKMYISNDAALPSDMTAEYLMSHHRSRPYNPNIANVFFRAGFIEAWGRGIRKICDACADYGVPLPEYSVKPYEVMVMFHGRAPVSATDKERQSPLMNVSSRSLKSSLTEREQKVLSLLKKKQNMTQAEIAETLKVSRRQIQLSIIKLVDLELIARDGSKKAGYWRIIDEQ